MNQNEKLDLLEEVFKLRMEGPTPENLKRLEEIHNAVNSLKTSNSRDEIRAEFERLRAEEPSVENLAALEALSEKAAKLEDEGMHDMQRTIVRCITEGGYSKMGILAISKDKGGEAEEAEFYICNKESFESMLEIRDKFSKLLDIEKSRNKAMFRWKLIAGVSTVAFIAVLIFA